MFDRAITYGFLEIPSEFELISEPANTAFESQLLRAESDHRRLQSSLNLL